MNSRGLIVAAVIVILIVVGIAMWGGSGDTANAEPIKIGVMSALSGDAAPYGEPFRNIVQMAVEEINAAGGVEGSMIEAVYEDDMCDGPGGASAATKLINIDKVKVILGGVCSSATLAAVPVAEQAKVLVFSSAASSPDLTGKSPYFFRNYPSDAAQGEVLAQVATNKGFKKVAFIQENKDYPLGIFKAFDATFKSLGGTTIKEEFVPDATDFRSIIAKLKASNPDALFVDVQVAAAADRILKQLSESGWKIPVILNDVPAGDPALLVTHKAVVEGAFTAEYGTDPANTKFQHMIEAYKAKFGTDVPYQGYAQAEYDSVYMLADGIRAVGYDAEKLAAWSRTVKDWPGASGMVTIGANGDRAGGFVAKVVKDGKLEILTQ